MDYGTRDVASLLGLSERAVRRFVNDGIVEPSRGSRRAYRFSFRDLVLLRAAAELRNAGLPERRIRRAMVQLRGELGSERSLGSLRISTDGHDVVAVEDGSAWSPASGQALFEFAVRDLAKDAAPIARRSLRSRVGGGALDADDWFEIGCEIEDVDEREAARAYARALGLDRRHVDAHINLGRLLHSTGEFRAAEHHYREALSIDPGNAVAAFNLGVALEDRGRRRDAERAYRLATECDASLPDAWFNLSRIRERAGDPRAAIACLKRYRALVRGG